MIVQITIDGKEYYDSASVVEDEVNSTIDSIRFEVAKLTAERDELKEKLAEAERQRDAALKIPGLPEGMKIVRVHSEPIYFRCSSRWQNAWIAELAPLPAPSEDPDSLTGCADDSIDPAVVSKIREMIAKMGMSNYQFAEAYSNLTPEQIKKYLEGRNG